MNINEIINSSQSLRNKFVETELSQEKKVKVVIYANCIAFCFQALFQHHPLTAGICTSQMYLNYTIINANQLPESLKEAVKRADVFIYQKTNNQ